MGTDIKKLRNRIKSVDNTLHLTKAMELVASSKIRRTSEAMVKSREYVNKLKQTIDVLVSDSECKKSPYLLQRKGSRTRLVVIAGDRGLAGGYNANVFRVLKDFENAELYPIGKKACEKLGAKHNSAELYSYAEAMELANKLCEDFVQGEYDRLGIVCTKYYSIMSQIAEVEWVLPISSTEGTQGSIIFEPDELTVFNSVVPEYVAGMIVGAVRESFACEVAARRIAMNSAGKNARKMIDDLGLEYNRARQGSITQEITEIVAGSGS